MKKLMLSLFVASSFMMTGCSDDDDNGNVVGAEETTTYDLRSSADNTVMGTTTIQRNADNTTTVTVEGDNNNLQGQQLRLNRNSAAATGTSVLTLNDYDASTGTSTTTFSAFDDGTPVAYEDLMEYDGHIGMYNEDGSTYSAYSDIGQNRLTGDSRTYQLRGDGETEPNGTVTFERRMNNTTLATVAMNDMEETDSYPVRIYEDNAVDGETPSFDLNPVEGTNRTSMTQIESFNDGVERDYNDIMDYDGHVRVLQSENQISNVRGRADIGQNELTGNTQTYNLDAVGDSNMDGTFTVQERLNGETLATMQMNNGTAPGVNNAAFINSGPAGSGTAVPTRTLNPVDGNTGTAYTNIADLDDGSMMDYNGLMEYDGNVSVHTSADPTSPIGSQGNIGANFQ